MPRVAARARVGAVHQRRADRRHRAVGRSADRLEQQARARAPTCTGSPTSRRRGSGRRRGARRWWQTRRTRRRSTRGGSNVGMAGPRPSWARASCPIRSPTSLETGAATAAAGGAVRWCRGRRGRSGARSRGPGVVPSAAARGARASRRSRCDGPGSRAPVSAARNGPGQPNGFGHSVDEPAVADQQRVDGDHVPARRAAGDHAGRRWSPGRRPGCRPTAARTRVDR